MKDNDFVQSSVKSVDFSEFPFLHWGVNLNPETAHRGLEWLQGAFQSPMESSGVFDLGLNLYAAVLDLYIKSKT